MKCMSYRRFKNENRSWSKKGDEGGVEKEPEPLRMHEN